MGWATRIVALLALASVAVVVVLLRTRHNDTDHGSGGQACAACPRARCGESYEVAVAQVTLGNMSAHAGLVDCLCAECRRKCQGRGRSFLDIYPPWLVDEAFTENVAARGGVCTSTRCSWTDVCEGEGPTVEGAMYVPGVYSPAEPQVLGNVVGLDVSYALSFDLVINGSTAGLAQTAVLGVMDSEHNQPDVALLVWDTGAEGRSIKLRPVFGGTDVGTMFQVDLRAFPTTIRVDLRVDPRACQTSIEIDGRTNSLPPYAPSKWRFDPLPEATVYSPFPGWPAPDPPVLSVSDVLLVPAPSPPPSPPAPPSPPPAPGVELLLQGPFPLAAEQLVARTSSPLPPSYNFSFEFEVVFPEEHPPGDASVAAIMRTAGAGVEPDVALYSRRPQGSPDVVLRVEFGGVRAGWSMTLHRPHRPAAWYEASFSISPSNCDAYVRPVDGANATDVQTGRFAPEEWRTRAIVDAPIYVSMPGMPTAAPVVRSVRGLSIT